ncbi:hypothetical protein TSO221_13540 [Azospirillum sp. TSO22-1]|nr:hypothetical protein TSO221_13540 [Azospirillum sp. TSO22-1]
MTQKPADMASVSAMRQDPDRPGAWLYKVQNVDFKQYSRFIIEPATIYRGPEASFAGMSDGQLNELATMLTAESRRALGDSYAVTTRPTPGTARVVQKIVSVEEGSSGSSGSRTLPIGAVSNAVQGAPGGSSGFTGSLVVATEIYDAQSSKLLAAAVRRYTPPVFDVEATMSSMDTARTGVRQAAADLRTAVDVAQGKRAPLNRMPGGAGTGGYGG